MSRAEYSKLIDGLFEAAMLINSATGAILHVNMKGQVLFGFPPLSYASCAPVTSDHFTFWTHNMDVNTIGDVMGWSDVVQLLQHGKKAPDEWSITGTTQDGEKDFPGLAKLTYMKDYELGNGRAYIIGVFRHADDHESQSSKGGGTFGSESSTREAGMPRRRRTSFINEALFGDSGVILPTTIDEQDVSEQRRLSMLQSSLLSSKADNDTFTNSITDAVQRESIMTAIVEASLDPLFQINESGIIQMMNDAAITTFGYERDDLLGKNISRICGGSHAEHHNSYIQRYLATGDARIIGKRRELMAVKRDGTEFPIELAVVEVDTFLGDERLFCGFVRDLTHAKEGERITNGILESSLDAMILTDAEGLILKVNEAAISILGWSKEEFIGKDADFIIAGEEATKHERYLKQYDETGMTDIIGKRRELSALKRDGSELPIELYVVKVKGVGDMEDKYCGFLRDMSEIKEKEALVLKRERLLTSIINASVDPLFQIDENGTIRTVNPAACELFGYTDTELRGANICTIVGTEHSTSHDTNIDRDLDTGIKKIIGKRRESIARKHDGTEFAVEVSIVEVATEEGSERLFCGFITDLTEKKKLMEVQIEKTAAEVLLMNVLPEKIANQLLQDPQHIAESHKCAGIMFADICGFTEMSSKMKPKEVVSMLNELFSMFDEIVEEYALNKVKTIGDCYMVTCVPPQSDDDDKTECANVCHFALDMLDALRRYNSKNTEHNLNLRIGVNIGEVVAGVVGTKRFLYDLWGDAVNTASRMESSGIPGRIQVTTDVVNLLDDIFVFEKRGPIEVKGKGTMVTYFLTERKQLPHKSLIMRREDGMLSESQAMLFDENARMTLVQTLHRLEDAMNSSSANLGDLPFEEEILVSKGAATTELLLERNS